MKPSPRIPDALRVVVREVRDFPATFLFCASWIAVFAAMVVARYGAAPPSFWQLAVQGLGEARRFGDLTLRDLANGEVWRLMTCNFVHYSLIHIGLNLFAFYILGTLLESWYGPWRLAAIYGITGVGGNLLSAAIRHALGSNPLVHSGGGSVVIMGLIGLCATAGWRSKSTRDRDLTWQMVKALAITGLLGIVFPRYIDNWGHAGGALVGLPLGLTHRGMLARRGRPAAWGLGVAAWLVIVASAFAQLNADRREADLRLGEEVRARLDDSIKTMRILQALRLWVDKGGDGRLLARALESRAAALDRPPTDAAYKRLYALAVQAAQRELSEAEIKAFSNDLALLQMFQRGEVDARQRAFWDHQRKARTRVAPASTRARPRAPVVRRRAPS